MPDRPTRIAQFIHDRKPTENEPVEVLCEDHNGTYTLPFLCHWSPAGWINGTTSERIQADVVGWRPAPLQSMTANLH